MKKIIEDKKKKSSQQELIRETSNSHNGNYSKGFKNTKKGGSLNKQQANNKNLLYN